LPYYKGFARIRLRYLGNFKFLIGRSGRPSHESNYYSILYFVIADPHQRARGEGAPIESDRLK